MSYPVTNAQTDLAPPPAARQGAEPVTVLYGIGAQKAGTTWLYDYLSKHPQCSLRPIKELYYFNHLEPGPMDWTRPLWSTRLKWLQNQRKEAKPERFAELDRRIAKCKEWLGVPSGDHAAYLDYLAAGRGDRPVVADITPSYALLSADKFRLMAAITPRPRFVYLMRDPLDRLWSNCRMAGKRNSRANPTQEATGDKALELFDRVLAGEARVAAARCDYARTLLALYEALPPELVFVGFFETLFSDDSTRRITDFLGIDHITVGEAEVVHPGFDVPLDAERTARGMEFLEGQYRFVERFFDGAIPDAWRVAMAEAGWAV